MIADLEAADGAPLDALDRHPEVKELDRVWPPGLAQLLHVRITPSRLEAPPVIQLSGGPGRALNQPATATGFRTLEPVSLARKRRAGPHAPATADARGRLPRARPIPPS